MKTRHLPLPRATGAWFALMALLAALPARALIRIGSRDPLTDPGWPKGTTNLVNQPSRMSWSEGPPFGGGEWTFYHRGSTEALQASIDAFAAIEAPTHELRIHLGHPANPFPSANPSAEPERFDWSATVWVTDRWKSLLGPEGPPFMSGHPDYGATNPPLRLDVWIHAGGPDWQAIHVPRGVTVRDGRASSHGYRDDRVTVRVQFQRGGGDELIGAQIEFLPESPSPSAPLQEFPAPIARGLMQPDGWAVIANVEPGIFRLIAGAPGHVSRVVSPMNPESENYQEFVVTLALEAALEGIVFGPGDQPEPGVKIQPMAIIGPDGRGYPMAVEVSTITGPDGRFRLTPLPAGKIQYRADKAGLSQRWDPRQLVQLPAPLQTIHMVPTGALRVRVLKPDGSPAQQSVHIQESARSGTGSWGGSSNPDPNGWVEFREMPIGEYMISPQPFISGDKNASTRSVLVEVSRTNVVEIRW